MENFLRELNIRFARLPGKLRTHRWLVWGLYLLITIGLAIGAERFQFSWGSENPLSADDPIRLSLEKLKDVFGGTRLFPVVYQPKDGDLFSSQTLKAVKALHEELDEYSLGVVDQPGPLDHIVEVRSIIHTNYTEIQGDSLSFHPFIGEALPQTVEESQRYQQLAFEHPDYTRTFFSKNGQYGNLLIRTDFGAILEEGASEEEEAFADLDLSKIETSSSEQPDIAKYKTHTMQEYIDFERAVLNILMKPQYTHALEFQPSPWGVIFRKDVFESELNNALIAALGAGSLIVFFLFFSLSALLWPLVIVGSSIVAMLGLAGWFQVTIDLELYIVIGLISVASIADSIHVLSGYLYFKHQGLSHEDALFSVFETTGLACLLTSVTTAIGLFSLFFVPITTIRNMGVLGGVGVLIAFVMTVIMMPLMFDLWAPSRKRSAQKSSSEQHHIVQLGLRKLEGISYHHTKSIIGFFLVVGGLLVFGSSKVLVNTNHAQEYKEETSLRQVIELLNQHFGGTGNLELMVETGQQDGLKDPRILNMMERLENYMEQEYPQLGLNSFSLVNIVKDTYQKLNENRQEMYRIPQDPKMIAQILLLVDTGNSEERQQVVSDDFSTARVTMQLKDPGSGFSVDIVNQAQAKVDQEVAELKSAYPHLKTRKKYKHLTNYINFYRAFPKCYFGSYVSRLKNMHPK